MDGISRIAFSNDFLRALAKDNSEPWEGPKLSQNLLEALPKDLLVDGEKSPLEAPNKEMMKIIPFDHPVPENDPMPSNSFFF